MVDLSWRPGQGPTNEQLEQLRLGEPVTDLTVSKVYVPVEQLGGTSTFRFYNTDPKNWNLFMFPFESRKVRKKIKVEEFVSAGAELLPIVGSENADFLSFSDGRIRPQLEVKFSKSTGSNTLYIFFYRAIGLNEQSFPFEAKEVRFSSAEEAMRYFADHAGVFASNVPGIVRELLGNV